MGIGGGIGSIEYTQKEVALFSQQIEYAWALPAPVKPSQHVSRSTNSYSLSPAAGERDSAGARASASSRKRVLGAPGGTKDGSELQEDSEAVVQAVNDLEDVSEQLEDSESQQLPTLASCSMGDQQLPTLALCSMGDQQDSDEFGSTAGPSMGMSMGMSMAMGVGADDGVHGQDAHPSPDPKRLKLARQADGTPQSSPLRNSTAGPGPQDTPTKTQAPPTQVLFASPAKTQPVAETQSPLQPARTLTDTLVAAQAQGGTPTPPAKSPADTLVATQVQTPYKAPAGAGRNMKICAILKKIGEHEKNQGDGFRAKAYAGAVRAIQALRSDVQSGKDAKKLEGVGKSMAAKIDEIIETGTLTKYKDILADPRKTPAPTPSPQRQRQPRPHNRFTLLSACQTPGSVVTLLGVAVQLEPSTQITTRSGMPCNVASVLLSDTSRRYFKVTLWGGHANLTSTWSLGSVLLMTDVKLTTFRNNTAGSVQRKSKIRHFHQDVSACAEFPHLFGDVKALLGWSQQQYSWMYRGKHGQPQQHVKYDAVGPNYFATISPFFRPHSMFCGGSFTSQVCSSIQISYNNWKCCLN